MIKTIKTGYQSADKAAKLQWRFGYAGIYMSLFPKGLPKDKFVALLPYKFVAHGGKVKPNSQPSVFEKVGLTTKRNMICVDKSKAVVASNKRAQGYIHTNSAMSSVAEKFPVAIVDYDGMRSVRHEVEEVSAIIKALNEKDHDCALLVNCSRLSNGIKTPLIEGTTLDEFKKFASFREAIRKPIRGDYAWEIVSKPMSNVTHYLPMESFVLYKRMVGKDKSNYHLGALKAWETRRKASK